MNHKGNESKQIKVLRIISRMNVGGPALQVVTLAQGLKHTSVEEMLLIGECGPEELDYLETNKISLALKVVPGLGRRISVISDLRSFFFIWNQIRKFEPNIVHTHTFKAGLLGRLAAILQLNPPRIVHTFHGHLLYGYWSGIRLKLLIGIERFLAKRTDSLVAVGRQIMNELIDNRIGKDSQYVVVPPGFSMKVIKEAPIPTNIEKRTNSDFVCLWVGRMVPIKRPDRLLELGREIRSRRLNMKIYAVGDGPLRQQVESKSIQEGLPVQFHGWRNDVQDLLLESDVLILTSDNEGTPISIIEAQRMGLPVVATDVGAVKEVINPDNSGFAIHYDPKVFIDKLALLADSRELRLSQSKFAREFARDRFSPERLVEDHIRIYEKLITT